MNAVPLQEDEFQELRQVCCELRERLRAGESARVEELLEIHPLLARNDDAVLELIHAEVSTRNDMGQKPTLEEWEERFPRLLPRMEQIVSLRSVFDSEMPTLTDSSAGTADPLASVQAPDGRLRIGNYQILQEIGRGGMGVVYKARQANLSRIVALKMILAGEHSGLRERARLRNEAQAAAQLMHPNVVQIFEIGEHQGLPFLAMEYVAGGNLTRTLRAMPQAFRWSARLTETMARAIHVAHQRGIVHRDLNPSNILIALDGTPKISDFGLAKFLVDDKGLSLSGVFLGTPSYMAPEQVSGNGQTIGPGTDVYALGALLYEMLTGAAPFRGFTPMETLCQVMEAQLVPPSRLRHGVPEDLETICLKCLDRDPARRYSSAEDLAEDLRRYQEHQPIRACRTSKCRQALQWTRRQPQAGRLLGLCFLLLITLLGVVITYSLYVTEQNRLSELAWSRAIKLKNEIAIERDKFSYEASTARRRTYDAQLFQVKQSIESGQIELAQELFQPVLENFAATAKDPAGFELQYLNRLIERAAWLLEGHGAKVSCLAVSRREGTLVSGDSSGQVIVWDLDRKIPRYCQGKHNAPVCKVAIVAGDETRRGTIASLIAQGGKSVELKLWNTATGALITTLHTGSLQDPDIQFSPDGSLLTLCGLAPDDHGGQSYIWKLNSASPPDKPSANIPGTFKQAFSPDGKLLAAGGCDGTVRLHVMADLGSVHRPPALEQRPGGRVTALAFSRDGSRLAAGRQDHGLTVWEVATGRILAHYTDQDGPVVFVDFCLDGKALVGCEGTTVLWTRPLDQPGPRRLLPGVESQINSVCLSSDGRLLAAAARIQPVIIWNLSAGTKERSYLANNRSVDQVEFTPDNKSLILGCKDRQIRVWRFLDTPDLKRSLAGHQKEAWALTFSPDGSLLASGSDDHTIKLWDIDSERELLTLTGHSQTVTALAFFHEGDRLASVSLDGKVILWDLTRTGPDRRQVLASSSVLHAYDDRLRAVSVSSDDQHLAAAGSKGLIHICDVAERGIQFDLAGHTGPVYALAYSPNPWVLASASADRTVRWWDPNSGAEIGNEKRPFAGVMRSVAFSADGLMMAAGGDPRNVTLWSMNSWEVTRTMTGHPLTVRAVAFSPDFKTIATGCDDEKVRLWDTVTGQQFYALLGHTDRINAVAFSPDGKTLASCDHKGKILLWKTRDPVGPSSVVGH
ncbi:MAG: protein kinase [Isosphaeraceae bacterium]|jgi:WD40 repeat protein/tRNA A-37 threonylcarbamoyl transferase component Bud32